MYISESGGNNFFSVNVVAVQKQRCNDNFGVFAIAFALHAHCLEEIDYDQAKSPQVLHYKKLYPFFPPGISEERVIPTS